MNRSQLLRGLGAGLAVAIGIIGPRAGVDKGVLQLTGPREAQAHNTTSTCEETWDNQFARVNSWHKFRNHFYSASALDSNGRLVQCPTTGNFAEGGYDNKCWTWRRRCGNHYIRLEERDYVHGHFWWEGSAMAFENTFMCIPADPNTWGYAPKNQGYSDGNCPSDSFYTNPTTTPIAYMHQHEGGTAMTIWSEHFQDHKPVIMDINAIQILPPENNPTCLPDPDPLDFSLTACSNAKVMIKIGPHDDDWWVQDDIRPNTAIAGQPGRFNWYDTSAWGFEVERVVITNTDSQPSGMPRLGGIRYATPDAAGWGTVDVCGNQVCSSTESCLSCQEDCPCNVPTATYPALTTAGCTGSKNCAVAAWGVDLNANTGYRWTVNGGTGGLTNLYVKAASPAGVRRMSLWVNNTRIYFLQADSTNNPRPTGTELGPIVATLNPGANNTVEVRDDQGTEEFDVHHVRIDSSVPQQTINIKTGLWCTGAGSCSVQSWGVDLNEGTGYRWPLIGGALGGPTNFFVKVASEAGSRTMGLLFNGTQISTITTNPTQSPRTGGSEFGPYTVTFLPGTSVSNTIELVDNQGTAELDAIQVRTDNKIPDATYYARLTNQCTGASSCTANTWGIDLNANTGYRFSGVSGGPDGGSARLYVRVSSPSTTNRSMGLSLNGTEVATITTNSNQSPRPGGREFGPFTVSLNDMARNVVTFNDNKNTDELDIQSVRIAE